MQENDSDEAIRLLHTGYILVHAVYELGKMGGVIATERKLVKIAETLSGQGHLMYCIYLEVLAELLAQNDQYDEMV